MILNENENGYRKVKRITIECTDPEAQIEKLLVCIKETASIGHTFDVLVDPDSQDGSPTFEIDGDGSCHIHNMTTEDIMVKE